MKTQQIHLHVYCDDQQVARATLVICGLLISLSVFKNDLTIYLQVQRPRFKKSNSWTELQPLWHIITYSIGVSTYERSLVLLAVSITDYVKHTPSKTRRAVAR